MDICGIYSVKGAVLSGSLTPAARNAVWRAAPQVRQNASAGLIPPAARIAAAAAADYIIQLNEEMEVEAEQVITDNGGTFGYFTEEDDAKYNQSAFTVMAAAAQKAADAIGDGENMTYILNACADYLGLEYEP